MIVDDPEEEKREMFGFFDRLNAGNPVLNLTVVLNLDCNFACLYCYEGEMKGKLYMSRETGDLLVRFIEENFSGTIGLLITSVSGRMRNVLTANTCLYVSEVAGT